MRKYSLWFTLLPLLLIACQDITTSTAVSTPTATPPPLTSVHLLPIANGLDHPVSVTNAGDERLFVIEQAGLIRIINQGELEPEPFLDIRNLVRYEGKNWDEQGFLGLVFHPEYTNPAHVGYGRFFVNYTDTNGNTMLTRYQVSTEDPNRADPLSATTILTITQPYERHNAGQLQFGPDGYLYMSVGDGGSFGDPDNHAQSPNDLLGTILRLDVDHSGERPYTIPPDNPFVNDSERRDEIWAYGFRNPWRFSFDALTGDLFIADVGQDTWEELDWQAASSHGGENYGWHIMEGPVCYNGSPCDKKGLIPPIYYYNHSQGCAVVGGQVYRGSLYPQMQGLYLFTDFCQGEIWALQQNAVGKWQKKALYRENIYISSFGVDSHGEIYVVDNTFGTVFQIQP